LCSSLDFSLSRMHTKKIPCVLLSILAALVASTWAGCGTSKTAGGPSTVPVRGKLVFTRGGAVKALFDRQGRIELESVDQPGIHAMGAIEEDGSFSVATVTNDGSNPGAVPGTHRVRLDLDDNAQRLVAPQFLDFAKSGLKIIVPSTTPIEVQVWR